jgi:SNF2 family DNA or RNA helicase
MSTDKNYTTKIANLIEALSTLSGEDLEEAKTILIKAGKDKEKIVREGIEKLLKIQTSIRKKKLDGNELTDVANDSYENNGYFLTFDFANKAVELEKPGVASNQLLHASEIFDVFVRGNMLSGLTKYELSISKKVSGLKFHKILRNIFFNVTLKDKYAEVSTFLQWRHERSMLDADAINSIIETGYYIENGNWYSVDNDSMNFAKEFSAIIEKGKMPLKNALDFFAIRSTLSWVAFQPEEMDLSAVFNSTAYPSLNDQLFIKPLYDYQQDGLKWLQYCVGNRIGGILGDDMGLGKTAQAIALISWIVEKDLFQNILIVVPGTLLENWKREFAFFAPLLVPYVHHGNVRTGSAAFLKQKKIVLTSYSMIINDVFLFDKITWGFVLLDEASLIKNPDSERRTALQKIPSEVRIAMSGTPVENSLMDLWSLADYVYPGYFGTREQFSGKYIQKDIQRTLQNSNLKEIKAGLSHIMLRRKKEDVLASLPEKIDIHQAIVMNEIESEQYDEQRNKILNEKDQISVHVFKMIQDLRQYTTHPMLMNGTIQNADLAQLKNSCIKFSRTVEILDEIFANGEKVLIFTEYLDMIDVMQKVFAERYRCPVYTIDGRVEMSNRQLNIDKFSQGNQFGMMVLNPKTAGMGLNITAANHVIHYTRQWNPALEEQATARAYRNGQGKCVNVYYLYYADTIEETIDERLRAKRALSGEVVDVTGTDLSMEQYISALSKSPIKK